MNKEIDAYRVCVFVPEKNAESFIEAIQDDIPSFLGPYDRVLWLSDLKTEAGIEQFRPLEGAKPHQGTKGSTSREKSVRLEFLIPYNSEAKDYIVNKTLRPNHPFDDPVIILEKVELLSK